MALNDSFVQSLIFRFHLASEHYFPEGSFKDLAPAKAEDMVPGALLPKDLVGKVHKYTCYLQLVLHNF